MQAPSWVKVERNTVNYSCIKRKVQLSLYAVEKKEDERVGAKKGEERDGMLALRLWINGEQNCAWRRPHNIKKDMRAWIIHRLYGVLGRSLVYRKPLGRIATESLLSNYECTP